MIFILLIEKLVEKLLLSQWDFAEAVLGMEINKPVHLVTDEFRFVEVYLQVVEGTSKNFLSIVEEQKVTADGNHLLGVLWGIEKL